MEPKYHTGERVYVNKLLLGARLYRNFDFTENHLYSYRIPGFRKARLEDVMILNYPYALTNDTINFKINYVYMKRCYGCPGDTVRIIDGYYIHPHTGERIGELHYQNILSDTVDSVLVEKGVEIRAYQLDRSKYWTIRNFGPLYVPSSGDTLKITKENWRLYKKQIQYETGEMPTCQNGRLLIGGKSFNTYVFKTDWYFFGGDNVLDSRDSRYFGLVPESYIVGIVCD